MRAIRLFFRSLVIFWVCFATFVAYLSARLLGRAPNEEARDRLRGELLAQALERLGATFIKFGQILGTRPDLIPPPMIVALARLQDAVPAAPFSEVELVLREELSDEKRARFTEIDETPIAAASVAQVHKGVLDDGSIVAIKVQRRAAASQIDRDLALMGIFARVVSWLPGMRYLSLRGAASHFADALRKQLDFKLEAENNRRLAINFAKDERICVPSLHDDLCAGRVLTMQFVDGVRPTDVPEKRPELAQAGFRCIAQMVFLDGFVHADMHPGNIMFTREGEIFLIDLGLVAEIPEELRKPWVDTFVAVATCDGRRAAELFYGFAPFVAHEDAKSYAAFEHDIEEHLGKLMGRPLHELEVTEAVGGAMAILRRHRVQVDPTFTVVNLAMLVAEGVGKQLDPQFDVYACAMPFLFEASQRYPTGREPLRPIPRA